ncbi:MAG: ribosomal subunit interface protein [Candidatus Magasanikbacteria bacterium RIFCSPHIGHO2_01_FULL_41_23]|uniref:Ribosomal subunit interface protein n=1 Tax=Candidatus Magasanikbacteria bacterium RIFCSPLOWO2_01_FULL_40_15 TaxID=1798686 RepID=A0A1F6N3I7_9BACT|nr:MAG: ribosomal subunit interface protein [Candidatus Magasanikbacteria bacterium RIFCSPHIGHO2_01_FULL_41_23]OGH76567.1 MAG: ribosomal subunit interface protein [Candidatus Magasanikbacteria bacterium RIFCSPHIGHO2_12_FULL_41_16]OGH78546.1 MAG: ribosomal subunit interface protein [Candidatus Magasanikbacteria bacterium RIFCSPLOWO2_01_FULL_40_15]
MITTIHGTGIDLTEAIKTYTLEKIGSLEKFFAKVTKVEIDIGLRTHHHQKGKLYYAEVNMSVPGTMIRVVKEAEDLYKAIDKVKDHLKIELETVKEKTLARDKKKIRQNKEYKEE